LLHIFRLNQFLLGLGKTNIQILKKGDFTMQNNDKEKKEVSLDEFGQIVKELEDNALIYVDCYSKSSKQHYIKLNIR